MLSGVELERPMSSRGLRQADNDNDDDLNSTPACCNYVVKHTDLFNTKRLASKRFSQFIRSILHLFQILPSNMPKKVKYTVK